MEILGGLLGLLVGGFLIGAFARFALPGPDPLPAWLTVAVGLGGSVLGGFLFGLLGLYPATEAADEDATGTFLVSLVAALVGATIVLFLFRRLVQKRPLTGPKAERMPLRPRGLGRILTGRPHRYLEETAALDGDPHDQLRKLVALRDAGQLDAAEFERRKAAIVERL